MTKKEGTGTFKIPHKYNKDEHIMIQHAQFFTKPEKAIIVDISLRSIDLLVWVEYTIVTSAGIIPGLNERTIDKITANADYINRMNQLKMITSV